MRSGTRGRLSLAVEAFQARLWPGPVAAILLAVVLGLLVPALDATVDPHLDPLVTSFVFGGGAQTARSVLAAIAGALVTATSLTFSLTVVALQLASSQASPRLLRTFARDPQVHSTLAAFLGTFAYSLTVLRAVRDMEGHAQAVVPRIAVTLGFVLALGSVVVLVFFLAHLAAQLRVETMLKEVHDDTRRTLRSISADIDEETSAASPAPEMTRVVVAGRSGVLNGVDRARLVALARRQDVVVAEVLPIGSEVLHGVPLLRYAERRPLDDDTRRALEAALHGCYRFGYERTIAQDVLFGVQQMVDIAVKALSPGINDPTTAVHAVGHLVAVLGQSVRSPVPTRVVADDDGIGRLVPNRPGFAEILDASFTQIRRYGAQDLDVAARLWGGLADLALVVPGVADRDALRAQAERLTASIAAASYDDADRAKLRAVEEVARERLSV